MNFDIRKKIRAKTKNKVGLDIGSYSVKILEVSASGDKNSLVCLGLKKHPSLAHEVVVETIKSLAEEIKVDTKDANISVSGPSVIVRFVSMPKMREDELKSAIKFEAEKYIPFAISDCIVDYQVLKKNDKEGKLDMLLVAVKKELVMERIAIAEEGGFNVGLVDVDTFAVANSFLKNFGQQDAGKTTALLNIGSTMTNVSIVRDGILYFSRDVAIGGADFNSAISKSLNIDSAMAESRKISPGDRLQDIVNCTKSTVNNLIDEMRSSFSYYENQSGIDIDEIYISGGGSLLAGLETAFHEAFESKPFLWQPLKFLDTSRISLNADLASNSSGVFAVAAGLAVR